MVIVWERRVLSADGLGEIEGDRPHEFENEERARAFMVAYWRTHPKADRYVRYLYFANNCIGVDFGSWSDFLVIENRDGPLNLI